MPLLPLVAGTALAAVLAVPLSIDLVVHERATVERGGTLVIRGTVTCSADTLVTFEGSVVESLGRTDVAVGTFATELPCGTGPTPWTVIVTSGSGVPFRPGFALGDVQVVGFDPESGVFTGVQSLVVLHLT